MMETIDAGHVCRLPEVCVVDGRGLDDNFAFANPTCDRLPQVIRKCCAIATG
jgi:hypothetical protein